MNEAAERLLIGPYAAWDRESWEGTEGVEAALCTAVAYMKISLGFVLAAERKATVERMPHSRMGPPSPVMVDAFVAVRLGPKMTMRDVQDAVNASPGLLYLDGRRMFDDESDILDAEAAR